MKLAREALFLFFKNLFILDAVGAERQFLSLYVMAPTHLYSLMIQTFKRKFTGETGFIKQLDGRSEG